MIKKVLLYYPYGELFQRGEDRSQGEIKHSSATSLRASNDLGYMAAVLRDINIKVKIVDYMGENKGEQDFVNDLQDFKPDLIVSSMTTATLLDDLKIFALAKEFYPNIITVAKGAYFYSAKFSSEDSEAFKAMDYALVGECETIIDKLVTVLSEQKDLSSLKGLVWRKEDVYVSNGPADFVEDLDNIPFPARDLMNNKLYILPITGEPQATIQIDRGCPFECSYCLTPLISGRKIRIRSVDNIIQEIEECVNIFGIRNFFFKSDTFTANRDLVRKLCDKIIAKKLNISWAANSRVKPIDYDTLARMKEAGCWLVAFGIEVGQDETLKRIKKAATVDDAVVAVSLAKKAGLQIFGFFLFGFPWETRDDIEQTIKLARQLKLDYYEFHICVLYPGTPLFMEALRQGYLVEDAALPIGKNYFTNPSGTNNLSVEELKILRRKALMLIYFSPSYIMRRFSKIRGLQELKNTLHYGIRLVCNLVLR